MIPNSGIQKQLLELGSQRLAVTSANENSPKLPVVFIHGITANVDLWCPSLPDSIRYGRHWISLSLPGHAPSQIDAAVLANWSDVTPARWAEWYDTALSQLVGDQPVQVVGWSTGGFTALALAAHFSKRVRSVMCISGFAMGRWSGLIGRMQSLSLNSLTRPLLRIGIAASGKRRWLFDWVMNSAVGDLETFRASSVRQQIMDAWFASFGQHSPAVMADLFRVIAQLDMSAQLSDINCPVLIAGGEADPYIPASHANWMVDQIPGAEKVIWPRAGHLFFAERTSEYQELLVDWLERTL